VPDISTPGTYGLYVGDGILREMVKVASHSGTAWSDFVFNKDYSLMPLDKVEEFVKDNKHLPAIPTQKEVNSDGIDLASMDAKLLQKVEELTLYVIQQQKEIDELKKQIK
jgi:trimeric autotransporter adhesin